jgi:hypothetical protein
VNDSFENLWWDTFTAGPHSREVLLAVLPFALRVPKPLVVLVGLPEPGESFRHYVERLRSMAGLLRSDLLPPLPAEPVRAVGGSVGWYSKFSGLGPPPPETLSFDDNPFLPSLSPLILVGVGG